MTEHVETLLFVDVDGVLNVGIRDPESKPISFNEGNVSVIRQLVQGVSEKDKSELLISVMRMHTCDGNTSTYGDFLSRNDLDVCDIFVHRLVKIMRAAGDKRRVIMSAAWRRPHYSANLKSLEKVISGYLGKKFAFDDRTAIVDESGAGPSRLNLIGEYITKYCQDHKPKKIKALVLDDFFYFPIQGYNCDGVEVDSLEAAEKFLCTRAPSTTQIEVSIIHTQLSGELPSGQEVHIGTGLSLPHLDDALAFLGENPDRGSRVESQGGSHVRSFAGALSKSFFAGANATGAAGGYPMSFTTGAPMSFCVGDDFDVTQEAVLTLIFLDIDGVLNIGIKDLGGPLSFNEANFSIARKLFQGNTKSDTADALLAVMRMSTDDGESSTYGDFLSRNDLDVCDVFIHRFVKIMRACGENRRVVISSSWRRPKYEKTLRALENIIGGYLCEPFEFDDMTSLDNEVGGHDRLCLIGDYIENFSTRDPKPTKVKAIVLDDLFYTPIKGFSCRGVMVNSLQEAEKYLENRAPSTKVKCKILHTQMTCKAGGLEVHVGTGLSLKHLDEALKFLRFTPGEAVQQPAQPASTGIGRGMFDFFLD